jgi:hypothetical protein
MHLYPEDKPWRYRDAVEGRWSSASTPPGKHKEHYRLARDYWEAFYPYEAGGAYVNFMMDQRSDNRHSRYVSRKLRATVPDQSAKTEAASHSS